MKFEMNMTKKQAQQIAGSLGNPSKMPGKSYGIPAAACITGSKLRQIPGSVCHDCYACKGCYQFSNVQQTLNKRLESIQDKRWVPAMVKLIDGQEFFRWHDSGDLQGEWHLLKIATVCDMTPTVRHWLPTKEAAMVRNFARKYGLPANLTVRISAPMVNSRRLKGVPAFNILTSRSVTEVGMVDDTSTHICPAPKQEGKCEDCRACWDPDVKDVAYLMH